MIIASLEKVLRKKIIINYCEELNNKKILSKCKFKRCKYSSMDEFYQQKEKNDFYLIGKTKFYLNNNKLYRIIIKKKYRENNRNTSGYRTSGILSLLTNYGKQDRLLM